MSSHTETISEIKLNSNNELHLALESGGQADYQYIYRAAVGVYWLNESSSFKFGPLGSLSIAEAYCHVIQALKEEMNLDLQLSNRTTWINITQQDRESIETENNPRK